MSVCDAKGLRCGCLPDPGISLHPSASSCLHGNQLLNSLQEDGGGGSRLQWTTTPSHPPWLQGQWGGGDRWATTPSTPGHLLPSPSWGPESMAREGQEWDGPEGGGPPQLPQLPPPRLPLSLLLPLADLGRKENAWSPEIQGEENSRA